MKTWSFWKPLDALELPALEWVEATRASGLIEDATLALTRAGEHGMVWYGLAAAGSVVDRRRRSRWIQAGGAVAASYLANTAIKFVVRRHRPPLAALETETVLSFPSSHAATSFAAARTMSQLLPRPLGPLLIYGAAVSVTGSRLHFCVHYPTDLAAGAALGEATGRALVRQWQRQDSPS